MRTTQRYAGLAGLFFTVILSGIWLVGGGVARQQNPNENKAAPEEREIHKALEQFVSGFNANDSKAMEKALCPGMEFIDENSQRVSGRNAVVELLATFFKSNAGAKIQLTPEGARVVSPVLALEDAESVITIEEKGKQTARRVSLVYALQEGVWKIASFREFPESESETDTVAKLSDLAWLEGNWVDENPDGVVETQFVMAKDGSHLQREFTLRQQGAEVLKGSQRIAVDPRSGSIRAWTFDSMGGHSESSWTKHGEGWLIRGNGVSSDGKETSATFSLKPLGKDRLEFKTFHKIVGNEVEPDNTTILVRKIAPSKR